LLPLTFPLSASPPCRQAGGEGGGEGKSQIFLDKIYYTQRRLKFKETVLLPFLFKDVWLRFLKKDGLILTFVLWLIGLMED
jgi:hypothetical protein